MNICTIIAKNYVAHARTLARSFTAHHPGSRCFVLFVDETDGALDLQDEPFEVVRPGDLDLAEADYDEMRGIYNVLEFSTAVKPWLLRYMLDEHDDGSGVCYFDPDISVYSPMTELQDALTEHQVVLTPHLTAPMPRDGEKPAETDILIAGVYNLGFIGLSAGPESDHLLSWWQERLRTDCRVDTERGFFVDQRWIDFVPGMVRSLAILELPTYNIAYWNYPSRELTRTADGYEVDGLPLRFFHFSGYGPDHRGRLSKHQTRVDLTRDETLRRLCDDYGDRLEADGFEEVRHLPYSHDVLPNGFRIDHLSRALYRAGIESGELDLSLFTTAGAREFLAWLNEDAPERPGLSRYLHALWAARDDLGRAFPDPTGAGRVGFVDWCRRHGREQVPIPEELLPEAVGDAAPAAPAAPTATTAPAGPPSASVDAPPTRPLGVNLAGYLNSELGIGEVARQVTSALDTTPIPSRPIGLVAPGSRQGHAFVTGDRRHNPFPVNLVLVNADGLPEFARQAGPGFFDRRYTIGYWWWEVEAFPEDYVASFEHVDEVWVGSSFVADVLSEVAPVPVVRMPVPVEFAAPPALRAGELGWPDAFTFLFSWDYNSVFRRKNPLGAVEAYRRAFGPDDGTALVLKCINQDSDPDHHAELQRAIQDRPDIVLMDGYLSVRDKNRVMASCDCYLSLHRSEGLGLTMAEAMYLEKPVVATNYSGNTEFMTHANAFPVDVRMAPVGADAGPYPADARWAEPDLDQAAALMRRVREDPDEAGRRARRAAADIREHHSPGAAGLKMAQRLWRLQQTGALDLSAEDRTPLQPGSPESSSHVERLVAHGAAPRRPSRFGKPGAAVRKLVLRAMKPYTAYQQDVNYALMEGAAAGMRDLRGATEQGLARLAARVVAREAEDHAAVMAELRRQRSTIDGLVEALSTETREREEVQRRGDRLEAELRAVPYMSSDVFRTTDAGVAGRVFGYEVPAAAAADDDYRAFEDLFRGAEEFIGERQRRYLPIIGDRAPVLDLGCGRGEFLDVLAAEGIEARGVDGDPGMVARCRAKGHDVHEGDGIDYLESCEDGSLGVIFSAQVVEHLPAEVLRRLLAVAPRKLRPGGLFIAETVNPHSIPALKAFWVDITHQHPLFPEALLAFCRIAGFSSGYVFHPNGVGDVDEDRSTTGEYAVVATVGAPGEARRADAGD